MTEDVPAGRFVIRGDHPCLPGHFPDRPVVPGVVLLDEAFALILARHAGAAVVALEMVKFLAPILPDEAVDVSYRLAAPDRVAFSGRRDGHVVMRGAARLRPGP